MGLLSGAQMRDFLRGQSRPMRLMVTGACRKYAVAAYKDEWTKLRPDVPIPATLFMQMHDDEYSVADYTQVKRSPMVWPERQEREKPAPSAAVKPSENLLMVNVVGRGCIGHVHMAKSGAAKFVPKEGGDWVWLNSSDLKAELPYWTDDLRAEVVRWLVKRRGADWLPPKEARERELARIAARTEAVAKVFTAEPAVRPDYQGGVDSDTALRRKLRMHGLGFADAALDHVPGSKLAKDAKGRRSGYLGKAP